MGYWVGIFWFVIDLDLIIYWDSCVNFYCVLVIVYFVFDVNFNSWLIYDLGVFLQMLMLVVIVCGVQLVLFYELVKYLVIV